MHLVTSLFILLASAHLLGRLSQRFGQPALAGHMLAGILLGPSLLAWLGPNAKLGAVADIAVLFVVMTAGLEMRLQNVLDAFRGRGAFAMLLGFALPAAAGAAVAAAFSIPTTPTIVIALCIAVTALPVALQILGGFGLLRTRIAYVSISGALLSDILVFMMLGVLIELAVNDRTHSASISAALAVGKLFGLIAVIVIAQWIFHRTLQRRVNSTQSVSVSTANLSFAVVFVLGLGALSELLGFHFAIGAFFAAMMITPDLIGDHSFERLENTCEVLTASLFGPVFLAYQGLQFDLQTLTQPAFVITLTVTAVIAKLLSGYLVGRLQRMSSHESWGVGIVSNARGVMELVVASIAFHAGLVDAAVFSALLVVGLVTTVLTPLMLRRWQTYTPIADRHTDSARTP
jgi:Kef-type K+ transport system membrane component KefB